MFYRDIKTKEVYSLRKIDKNYAIIDHCVRDIAWKFDTKQFKKRFSKLKGLQAEKAEILNDIVYNLNTEKYIASSEYLKIEMKEINLDEKELISKDIKEITNEKNTICSVCAIGSAFVSAVSIHNKFKLSKIVACEDIDIYHDLFGKQNEADISSFCSRDVFIKYLKKWFTKKECDLMEDSFENNCCSSKIKEFNKLIINKYLNLDLDYIWTDIQKDALTEIIANTLVNGTFMPEKGLAP